MWVIEIRDKDTNEYIGYYSNKNGRNYSYTDRKTAEDHLKWLLRHRNKSRIIKSNEYLSINKIERSDTDDN